MSEALPLPPRPNLEQYKKLAKSFHRACKSSSQDAIHGWAVRWARTIARQQGLKITPVIQRQIANTAEGLERNWLEFKQMHERAARCLLSDAQFFIAREHGFTSWPTFSKYLAALARADSLTSAFEAAADAIIQGDLARLEKLLKENPGLARVRSMREHRSTLLHYVSANGVEDVRQQTPENILEITKLLLQAGADVNAESDAYGGHSTTFGLAATSVHPENAEVQYQLLELLIAHGAIIDGPDDGREVNSCLHNGRGEAAEFLASRGARLDLEGAAGVGRLDVVKSFFNHDGSLKPTATREQMIDGFRWACEFGRISVVEFLLQHGITVNTQLSDGETGLHRAALGGHAEIVKLLLERKAQVNVSEKRFGGTPLGWALWGWHETKRDSKRDRYFEVVAQLVAAGATVKSKWLDPNGEMPLFAEKIRADPRMLAALSGEIPS